MPKLAVVSMIRNEADILPAFLRHIAALFDYAVLMDHGSIDGSDTMQLVAAGIKGWQAWRVEESAYFQEAFCGFAMRWLFENTDTDAVVFLDADEFISVQTRRMLDTIVLACMEQKYVGSLPWLNCLPMRSGKMIYHGCEFWRTTGKPKGSKVIIPRTVWHDNPSLQPGLGNHVACVNERALSVNIVGNLLHFPLRSVEQMKRKIVTGSLSVLAREDHSGGKRHHWLEAMQRLAQSGLDTADMFGMAASYSEKDAAFFRLPEGEIPHCGYSRSNLMVANENMPIHYEDANPPDPWQVMAACMVDWHVRKPRLTAPRNVYVALKDDVLTVVHNA